MNFSANPQGDIDRAIMSPDEAEATFGRKPEILDRKLLEQPSGPYETPTGSKFQVVLKEDGGLYMVIPGAP